MLNHSGGRRFCNRLSGLLRQLPAECLLPGLLCEILVLQGRAKFARETGLLVETGNPCRTGFGSGGLGQPIEPRTVLRQRWPAELAAGPALRYREMSVGLLWQRMTLC